MAREMLEGGITVIPRMMGQPYSDYPPLYFWLETLFSWPTGQVTTLTAVLPSAISAACLVALVSYVGTKISPRLGLISALVLATCPDFWLNASSATIDMLLALEVAVAVTCLWERDSAQDRANRILLGGCAAFAMVAAFFTKGPIGVVLPGVIWGGYLLTSKRWFPFMRFLLVMAGLSLICVTTELAYVWRQGGEELVREVLHMQISGRVGQKPNASLFYYPRYLLGAAGPWWPWVLVALIGRMPRDFWRKRRELLQLHRGSSPVIRLALVWFVAVLGLFSMASTRHGRYLLPLFPPLALLLGLAVESVIKVHGSEEHRLLERILAGLFCILLLTGWGGGLFFRPPGMVQPVWVGVWSVVSLGIWYGVKSCRPAVPKVFTRQVVVLITALTGATLLVHPVLSAAHSGRTFTKEAESGVSPETPVALFKIGRDGDGVKYALYSSRPPAALQFFSEPKELGVLARSQLVISFDRDSQDLLDGLGGYEADVIARGLLHNSPVTAYHIQKKENR